MGDGPAHQPSFSSEGPGSSDNYKPKRDTHLLLDVRDPRVRFQNAVRAVIKLQRTTPKRGAPVRPGLPRQNSWWQTSMATGPNTAVSPVPDPGLWALRGARVSKVIEELKALDLAQELSAHGALVRHLQFSPNGKYLATSRWGVFALRALGMYLTDLLRLFLFYQLGPDCSGFSCWGALCAVYFPFSPFARLWFVNRVFSSCRRHSRIIVRSCMSGASSVKWLGRLPPGFKARLIIPLRSPNGRYLLTRFTRGLKLWSEASHGTRHSRSRPCHEACHLTSYLSLSRMGCVNRQSTDPRLSVR